MKTGRNLEQIRGMGANVLELRRMSAKTNKVSDPTIVWL